MNCPCGRQEIAFPSKSLFHCPREVEAIGQNPPSLQDNFLHRGIEKRIPPVSVNVRPECPNGVWNTRCLMNIIRKITAGKDPEREACIDLILSDKRKNRLPSAVN